MKHLIIFILSIIVLSFSSCNKEGKGGAASIEGKVYVEVIKSTTLASIGTHEAQDERVFIIYGDNSTYNDDVKTSYDGSYKFDYLYKGDYQIYVYSECIFNIDSCLSESQVILEPVVINSSKGITTVPDITIKNYIN